MIKFPNINKEKKSILYEYRNGILTKVCPECREEVLNLDKEICCNCGQRFILLDFKKMDEKPKISFVRYIVYTKDKTKILTYRGFVDLTRINSGNPKLFPTVTAARQDLLTKYPEEMLNDCVFVKTDISYEEIK